MSRPPDEQRRAELLEALIAELASGGIGDRSLREIAEAVGTSHRMLLHYFGSREEMLLSIVQAVEHRQTAMLDDLPADPGAAFAAMWADLRRPEVRPLERLFFECYSRAAQGEEPFVRLLPGAVDGWLADVDERTGGAVDPAFVRLGLAVTRGLLLDLVATGDDAAVDAAAERFADLVRDHPQGVGNRRRSPVPSRRGRTPS